MGDDWQVGDLALCVDDSPNHGRTAPVSRGEIHTVEAVHIAGEAYPDAGEIGLFLIGVRFPSVSGAARATRFRKIRPSAIEHIEALKRVPVREGEPA